jgi:hypothetical protein
MTPNYLDFLEKTGREILGLTRDAERQCRALADHADTPDATTLAECFHTHERVISGLNHFAAALRATGVRTEVAWLTELTADTENVRKALDALRANRTPGAASSLAVADAKAAEHVEAAVQRLGVARDFVPEAPTDGGVMRRLVGLIERCTHNQLVGLLVGVTLGLIGIIILYVISRSMLSTEWISSLAESGRARGLITFLVGAGTIFIAVLVVIGALLSDDSPAYEKAFTRAKEVLTLLIGIFGTILGFYYGSERQPTGAAGPPAPLAITSLEAIRENGTAAITASVTGGRPPYTWSLQFENATNLNRSGSSSGAISQSVPLPESLRTNSLPVRLEVSDSDRNQVASSLLVTNRVQP